MQVTDLPTLNAFLNGCSFVLLVIALLILAVGSMADSGRCSTSNTDPFIRIAGMSLVGLLAGFDADCESDGKRAGFSPPSPTRTATARSCSRPRA